MDTNTTRRVTRTTGRIAVLAAGLWLLTTGDSTPVVTVGGVLAVFGAFALIGGE